MKHSKTLVEARALKPNQLQAKIQQARLELVKSRQQQMLGSLKNTAVIKQLRLEIARLQTVLDEVATEASKQ